MDAFVSQILPFAGNFVPLHWAACDGQLLAIQDYDALFSLIGTTYGGDGITTFAVPDLRGAVPVGGTDGTERPLSSDIEGEAAGVVAMQYIICVSGLYPSRD